jgi:hypothetical protein
MQGSCCQALALWSIWRQRESAAGERAAHHKLERLVAGGRYLKRGRLLTAYRQWHLCYRRTSYSRWVALRKLFVEPLAPERVSNWADRRRHPTCMAAWQDHAAIWPDFAAVSAFHPSII